MQTQLTLDILLNPSVKPEDERRLSRQARDIWSLFRFKRRLALKVSNADMQEIAMQYNARVNEVRHALCKTGWMIDLVHGENGLNFYEIVSLDNSSFWKKIIEKGEQYKWQ